MEQQSVPMGGTSSASGSLGGYQFPQGRSRQTPEGQHIQQATPDTESPDPSQLLPAMQRRFPRAPGDAPRSS